MVSGVDEPPQPSLSRRGNSELANMLFVLPGLGPDLPVIKDQLNKGMTTTGSKTDHETAAGALPLMPAKLSLSTFSSILHMLVD